MINKAYNINIQKSTIRDGVNCIRSANPGGGNSGDYSLYMKRNNLLNWNSKSWENRQDCVAALGKTLYFQSYSSCDTDNSSHHYYGQAHSGINNTWNYQHMRENHLENGQRNGFQILTTLFMQ